MKGMYKADSRVDAETTKKSGKVGHEPDMPWKMANIKGTRLPGGGKPKKMKKGY